MDDRLGYKEIKNDKFTIKSFYASLAQGRSELFLVSIVWNPRVSSNVGFFFAKSYLGKNFNTWGGDIIF